MSHNDTKDRHFQLHRLDTQKYAILKLNHTYFIIKYAGVLARHIVAVTIVCKAHVHVCPCSMKEKHTLNLL